MVLVRFHSCRTLGGQCPCCALQHPFVAHRFFLMVQTVRRTIAFPQFPLFVQFLDKFLSPVVVQRQVPELVRTVCSSWTRLVTCPLWALMVQTVLKLVVIPQVQFLDKVMVMPVVGFHGPDSPEAREHSTGAVLGQGYGFVDVVILVVQTVTTPSGGVQIILKVVNIPVMTQR